jgi:transcriptional regulator with XRE-family HTH domain
MRQIQLIDKLLAKGWKHVTIAKAVGVRHQTVSGWYRGKAVARERFILALEQLLTAPPLATSKWRKAANQAPNKIAQHRVATPAERARFFRNLLSGLGITRRELADHLEISQRGLDNLLDPSYTGNLLALIPVEKLERLSKKPYFTLEERFHTAARMIFGAHYTTGYDDDPKEREAILKRLSDLTGYHKRTLARYLPRYRHGGPTFLTHAIVIAFESAAVVLFDERRRPEPSAKPRTTPRRSR